MKYFVRSIYILFLFSIITVQAYVGDVVPGQSLWSISKRLGCTVDAIESKVCVLEDDISILGETLCSKIEALDSAVEALSACGSTALYQSDVMGGVITINQSGNYCLAEDITGNIDITASCVSLDLNKRCLTGVISISGDDVDVFGGNVTPPAPISAPAAAITIAAASDRAKIYNVVIQNANTATAGVNGRAGIEILGNSTYVCDNIITSGSSTAGGAATGGNGGNGIVVGSTANNAVVKNQTISTGSGAIGTATGGNGGHGISIESTATESEISEIKILFTGNGGNGATTNGNGGHGIYIQSTAIDNTVRNSTIRNTGAAGAGAGTAGIAGRAVTDEVTIVANASMVYANFAHNIANSVKYALQGLTNEQGIAIANPPNASVVNSFANVFVS